MTKVIPLVHWEQQVRKALVSKVTIEGLIVYFLQDHEIWVISKMSLKKAKMFLTAQQGLQVAATLVCKRSGLLNYQIIKFNRDS